MQLEADHQATNKQDAVCGSESNNPQTLETLFSVTQPSFTRRVCTLRGTTRALGTQDKSACVPCVIAGTKVSTMPSSN